MAQEAMFDIVLCKVSELANGWDKLFQSHDIQLTVYETIAFDEEEYKTEAGKYDKQQKEVMDRVRQDGRKEWGNRQADSQ